MSVVYEIFSFYIFVSTSLMQLQRCCFFVFVGVFLGGEGGGVKNKSARQLLQFLMCHEWFPESFPTRKKNEKAKFQQTLKVGDVFQGLSMKKEAGAYMDSFTSK